MTTEDIQRLLDDLEEAKASFDINITTMKNEGIEYQYNDVISSVNDIYKNISEKLKEIIANTPQYELVCERNEDYINRVKTIKFFAVLLRLIIWDITFNLANRSNSNFVKIVSLLAALLGWMSSELIESDLVHRFADPLQDKDTIDAYKTLDTDRYLGIKKATREINKLLSINRKLDRELESGRREKARVRRLLRRKPIINELKG